MSDLVLRVTELIGVIVDERVVVEVSVCKQERDDWRKRAEAAEAKLLEVRGIVAEPQRVPQWVAVPAVGSVKDGQLVALKPEDVEGFRVGDLVRPLFLADFLRVLGVVKHLSRFVEVEYPSKSHRIAYNADELTHKPVEVGDMVRISPLASGSGRVWKVREITANAGCNVAWFVGEGCARLADCIAVAP